VIGAPFHGEIQVGYAEWLQWSDELFGGPDYVLASPDGEAGRLAGTGVVDNDAGSLVELTTMRRRVGVGGDQALLFAGKENEASDAVGLEGRG